MLPNASTIGFAVHKTTGNVSFHCLLNTNNLFVKWLLSVKTDCAIKSYGLKDEHFRRISSLLDNLPSSMGMSYKTSIRYIAGWRQMPNLPREFYPPNIKLTNDMFSISPRQRR